MILLQSLFSLKSSIPKVHNCQNTTVSLQFRPSGRLMKCEGINPSNLPCMYVCICVCNGHVCVVSNPAVIGLSEGSVIAYYLSEFSVPVGQERAVDNEMTSVEKLVTKMRMSINELTFENVVTSGTVKETACHSVYIKHTLLFVILSVVTFYLVVVVFQSVLTLCLCTFLFLFYSYG